MRITLGIILIVMAVLLIGAAATFPVPLIIRLGLLLAAADLICTVFWRPLIGKGPIAQAMYPENHDAR